jgi:hypothetical protein
MIASVTRRAIAILLVGGCWTNPPAPTAARPAAPRARSVHVRIAGSDEFPDPPVDPAYPLLVGKGPFCATSGDPAPELLAPIARFAKARLATDVRGFIEDEPIVLHREGDPPNARARPYVDISIDAKTVLGSITVSGEQTFGSIFYTYCTHVTCTTTVCSVVIEPMPYEGDAG